MDFAVFDLETTGLSPSHHHRIIEISIFKLNRKGEVISEYTTLLNPERDLGPTHIHGIMAADVQNAPTFDTIAGDILHHLRNAVWVAHNAEFDISFLLYEFNRINLTIPKCPHICTMSFVRKTYPALKQHNLSKLCRIFNIPHNNAHSARADACATAALFKKCLQKQSVENLVAEYQDHIEIALKHWPELQVSGMSLSRDVARNRPATPSAFMKRIQTDLPESSSKTPELDPYLALLDQALLDREIDNEESDNLIWMAIHSGLGIREVQSAHKQYLRDLVFHALSDDVITEREWRDLKFVAHLLGIEDRDLEKIITASRAGDYPEELVTRDMNFQGKSVCFSGEMTCTINGDRLTRTMAQAIAKSAGMIAEKNVTQRLDYLVLADPNSMSSKARKARKYKIPILAENAFWLMLGIEVN